MIVRTLIRPRIKRVSVKLVGFQAAWHRHHRHDDVLSAPPCNRGVMGGGFSVRVSGREAVYGWGGCLVQERMERVHMAGREDRGGGGGREGGAGKGGEGRRGGEGEEASRREVAPWTV